MKVKELELDVISQVQNLELIISTDRHIVITNESMITKLSNRMVITYLAFAKRTNDKKRKARVFNKVNTLLNTIEILKSEVD